MESKTNRTDLLKVIRDRTYGLMDNFRRVLLTCDLNRMLYNQPLWKHIYHAMYWFDYWCCTPQNFVGADFHCVDLHSLDIQSNVVITQNDLLQYFERIRSKTTDYLESLTEDQLNEVAENCDQKSRFECILGQFMHVGFHLGNVNAITIENTGKWPYISARKTDDTHGLFEE